MYHEKVHWSGLNLRPYLSNHSDGLLPLLMTVEPAALSSAVWLQTSY